MLNAETKLVRKRTEREESTKRISNMVLKQKVFFSTIVQPHCNENLIYVLLFWELCDLSPNFHINVSVSDLYIPRIRPHTFLQQNRQTNSGNGIHITLTDT
jgi:hypothetical protein